MQGLKSYSNCRSESRGEAEKTHNIFIMYNDYVYVIMSTPSSGAATARAVNTRYIGNILLPGICSATTSCRF